MKTPPQKEEGLIPRLSTRTWGSPTFRGAIIGGATASIITASLLAAQPARSSAAVLIPSLGTIINEITQYYNVMLSYVDQWIPDLSGIINLDDWNEARQYQTKIESVMDNANRDLAEYHATGGGPYVKAMEEQLSVVRDASGRVDPRKAADYITPPGLLPSSGATSEDLNRVRDYSLLLTGDTPLAEVRPQYTDTLAGVDYEYSRVQALSNRMLAQDSVQQYSMAGPMIGGYRKHLEQVEDNRTLSAMTPGQLLAAQLDIMVHVQAPAAIDNLESSLRSERMLGALLAKEIQPDVDSILSNSVAGK